MNNKTIQIPEPKISRLVFSDTRVAWLWLAVRLYVGYDWLTAGWGKFNNAAWIGEKAGTAIQGFFAGIAIGKMAEGTVIAGVKHALVLIVFGYTAFILFG